MLLVLLMMLVFLWCWCRCSFVVVVVVVVVDADFGVGVDVPLVLVLLLSMLVLMLMVLVLMFLWGGREVGGAQFSCLKINSTPLPAPIVLERVLTSFLHLLNFTKILQILGYNSHWKGFSEVTLMSIKNTKSKQRRKGAIISKSANS